MQSNLETDAWFASKGLIEYFYYIPTQYLAPVYTQRKGFQDKPNFNSYWSSI